MNDNITLKSITAYRGEQTAIHNNQDGIGYYAAPNVPFVGLGAVSDQGQNQFTQELQLFGHWQKLNYIVGLYYFREDATYNLSNFFFSPILPSPAINVITQADAATGEREKAVNSSAAGYAHIDYAFNDQWGFCGGCTLHR